MSQNPFEVFGPFRPAHMEHTSTGETSPFCPTFGFLVQSATTDYRTLMSAERGSLKALPLDSSVKRQCHCEPLAVLVGRCQNCSLITSDRSVLLVHCSTRGHFPYETSRAEFLSRTHCSLFHPIRLYACSPDVARYFIKWSL